MLREPAAAGQFYPKLKSSLTNQIKVLLSKNTQKIDCIGAILPHAGYIYSGKVAVETASYIEPKETFIILGPNHSGFGPDFSIQTQGKWATPMGEIEIDEPIAKELLKNSNFLKEDSLAHKFEHSVEVELPILQYFNITFKFIPIVIMSSNFNDFISLGNEIAATLKKLGLEKKVTMIASSDMTHYEEQAQASKKDREVIDAILRLDIDLFVKTIRAKNVSMCGYGPATVLLSYAKMFGAKNAKLIKYQTSGDTSGDYTNVVGYAGIIIAHR